MLLKKQKEENKNHSIILDLYRKKEEIKAKLKEVEEEYDKKEKEIFSLLQEGKKFPWCWVYKTQRVNVAWKEKFIEFLGNEKAEKISQETPPTVKFNLGVNGIHSKLDNKTKPVKFP